MGNPNNHNPMKIIVGMSSGVDSAVAALLLKNQGHDVTGVFMKNWEEEEFCTAEEDFADAVAVCRTLDIPYFTVNFSKEYLDRVFSLFLYELKHGATPNPDVLCNSEIKFAAFMEFAAKTGADALATGHYARLKHENDGSVRLLKGVDGTKDQSYFLCKCTSGKLARAMFPVGELTKKEVRKIAAEAGLPVAEKKDSTGICFIGERKFREFLGTYLPAQPGEMRTLSGEYIGLHKGLMYYTIGQRRGLDIGGRGSGERWFSVAKDLERNILFVEQGDSPALYSSTVVAQEFNWIGGIPDKKTFPCAAKIRYRQPDQACFVRILENGDVIVEFESPQRAATVGQFVVLYEGEVCLGGGRIFSVGK